MLEETTVWYYRKLKFCHSVQQYLHLLSYSPSCRLKEQEHGL